MIRASKLLISVATMILGYFSLGWGFAEAPYPMNNILFLGGFALFIIGGVYLLKAMK
ncbi:hypothetical protein [Desertivirga xinjiangensis]|uniref:hypothetical protein n=1 Tax=Desertivirga xinjiangensis TaxID=539206 RepID=UPI00210AABE3|nr:hypothetical protein [Pedobacter xinjiangensis]